jgi:topoisomerase-4 subunit B
VFANRQSGRAAFFQYRRSVALRGKKAETTVQDSLDTFIEAWRFARLTIYARDDAHREALLKSDFAGKGKVAVSRFKGLGEMPAAQLRDTTMSARHRTLLRVVLPNGHAQKGETDGDEPDAAETGRLVERLMGRKPELRLAFIQENAKFVTEVDV